MHGLPGQNPTHVRPQAAITRRVWIAFFVCFLVVYPVRANPSDRSAFEGQRSADRKKILHPFWCLVAPVSEQPVVADANTKTS
jgi:hypothetical protein